MKFDFSILSFATSPIALIILFFALVSVFHLFIIYVKNPDDITWKRVDYLWLSLTLIGIVSTSGAIERHISKILLYSQEIPRLENSYIMVYNFFDMRASSEGWYCQKTNYESTFLVTKEEFEEHRNRLSEQCIYLQQILKKLPKKISEPYPSLTDLNLPSDISSKVQSKDEATHYQEILSYYNDQYLIYMDTKDKMEISDSEFFLLFLSPFFICLGLAIRVTKVTGDIMNTKKK